MEIWLSFIYVIFALVIGGSTGYLLGNYDKKKIQVILKLKNDSADCQTGIYKTSIPDLLSEVNELRREKQELEKELYNLRKDIMAIIREEKKFLDNWR